MRYKIGDRVRVKKDLDGINLKGKIGTIITRGMYYDYGIEFDDPIAGDKSHNCNGRGKDGHCRWGDEDELEPVDKKIVITTNGNTTLARLYEGKKVVKTAEAKCAPEDEFDFLIGAELAFERLTESKPKYYNGKVVCVKAGRKCPYTVGKIYEFIDGRVRIDDECIVPYKDRIKSLEDWDIGEWGAEFIKLKE